MRSAIWTTILASSLVGGGLDAAEMKAPLPDVGAGRAVWFDVTSNNLARSNDFFGRLFDWPFFPFEGTDLALEVVAGGTAIGTLRVAEGAISALNGVLYVQVNDIQGSCAKAKELGGIVRPGFPFNLPDGIGAIAQVADPSGHPLS